jgi:hypothetical protein
MCVANVRKTPLVNGLLGKVVGFADPLDADSPSITIYDSVSDINLAQEPRPLVPIVVFQHSSRGQLPPVFVKPFRFKWTDPEDNVLGVRIQVG